MDGATNVTACVSTIINRTSIFLFSLLRLTPCFIAMHNKVTEGKGLKAAPDRRVEPRRPLMPSCERCCDRRATTDIVAGRAAHGDGVAAARVPFVRELRSLRFLGDHASTRQIDRTGVDRYCGTVVERLGFARPALLNHYRRERMRDGVRQSQPLGRHFALNGPKFLIGYYGQYIQTVVLRNCHDQLAQLYTRGI